MCCIWVLCAGIVFECLSICVAFGLDIVVSISYGGSQVPPVPSIKHCKREQYSSITEGKFLGIPGEVRAICFGGFASPILDTAGYNPRKTARKCRQLFEEEDLCPVSTINCTRCGCPLPVAENTRPAR